jgi:hypothetical protein
LSIPLDRDIAEAYARGRPLVSAKPEYIPILQEVFQKIEGLAARASNAAASREARP